MNRTLIPFVGRCRIRHRRCCQQTVSVAKELEALEKRRKSIAGKIDSDQGNMQRLAVQARILQDAIDAGKDSTGELKKAFDNTLVSIAKASGKAEELRGQVLGLVAGLQINGRGLSVVNADTMRPDP